MKVVLFRYLLRLFMFFYVITLWLFSIIGLPKKNKMVRDNVMLITGTFYSDNWLLTHLLPLAKAKKCRKIYMVAATKVPEIENVVAIYPPKYLRKIFGSVLARLITFSWVAIRVRPDILAGFHLLLNGLVVVLVSKIIGVRSLYICGGGPREVLGGGYTTENRLFNRLKSADPIVERFLLYAVSSFDYVITMGTSAVEYFKNKGVNANYYIVPGGFPVETFFPGKELASYDLILVGRISEVKRVDRFIEAVALLTKDFPTISAVIVGDGPLREEMQNYAGKLGITKNVTFAGWKDNIEDFLRDSKIFVLTSDSEGLSQALIQAMLCGLPGVVSDVGDLGDLVKDGENGFLVSELSPKSFSICFNRLLNSQKTLNEFSRRALKSSEMFMVGKVADKWDEIL